MGLLRRHDVTLPSGITVLRPMTEDDRGPVHKWWNDPEVAKYADTVGNPDSYTVE